MNPRQKAEPDLVAARELLLWIENSERQYNKSVAIVKNLARKIKRGVFDFERSVKLWMYLADAGAREYSREIEGIDRIPPYFNKATWNFS